MAIGIALLLSGSSGDLSAIIHAIELAKRTTGLVHAVFINDGPAEERKAKGEGAEKYDTRLTREQLITLATRLSDVENVNIHLHVLESLAEAMLVRFLCAYKIFCLILGVDDQPSLEHRRVWIDRLRQRLKGERDWYLPAFWSVLVRQGDELDFEDVFTRFKEEAWSVSGGKMFAADLQKDLNEFIELEE